MTDDYDPQMIEAMRAEIFGNPTFDTDTCVERIRIEHALRLIGISATALNVLWRGEATVVPKVLTAAMVKATERVELADSDYPFTTFEAEEAHAIFAAMLAASPYTKETKNG